MPPWPKAKYCDISDISYANYQHSGHHWLASGKTNSISFSLIVRWFLSLSAYEMIFKFIFSMKQKFKLSTIKRWCHISEDNVSLSSRKLWIKKFGFRISDRIKVTTSYWTRKWIMKERIPLVTWDYRDNWNSRRINKYLICKRVLMRIRGYRRAVLFSVRSPHGKETFFSFPSFYLLLFLLPHVSPIPIPIIRAITNTACWGKIFVNSTDAS